MKKILLSILLLGAIYELRAENTSFQVDSLRRLLKSSPGDTCRIKIMNDLSAYLADMDSMDQAMKIAVESKQLSIKIDFKSGIASAYRKIGLVYLQLGEYPKSLENLFQSLKMNEELKNQYEIFMLHNNIGNVYYCQKSYSQALQHLFEAYKYRQDNIFNLSLIGITYMNQGEYGLALQYLQKELKICQKTKNKNGIAGALNAIGTVYEYQGDNDKALQYYFQSLKIKQEVGDNIGISDAMAGIGDVYFKKKNYQESINYENKSLELAKEIDYLISVQQTEQKLSEIYDAIQQPEVAYLHYKNYIKVRDKIYNEEQTKKSVRAEMNFDFDKKQAVTNAIHSQALKHQQILRNIFITGFSVILLFSVFLFRSFKKTQKQKNIIEQQKKITEHIYKEVTDNIHYAKRIQDAVMTPVNYIKEVLPNSFIYNAPKDIVSGDFCFLEKYNNEIIVGVADCTNHGVSGSMMTILCNSLLGEAIANGISSPGDILNFINTTISKKFHQTDVGEKMESDIVKDGMDLVLCKINLETMQYEFSGAYNPLIIIRNNELMELKTDKLQMGQTKEKYKNNCGKLERGDMLYMSSDGYADQFSSDGKKFMKKKFKELLLSIQKESLSNQKNILEETHSKWKNNSEQTDDILVMGIRI